MVYHLLFLLLLTGSYGYASVEVEGSRGPTAQSSEKRADFSHDNGGQTPYTLEKFELYETALREKRIVLELNQAFFSQDAVTENGVFELTFFGMPIEVFRNKGIEESLKRMKFNDPKTGRPESVVEKVEIVARREPVDCVCLRVQFKDDSTELIMRKMSEPFRIQINVCYKKGFKQFENDAIRLEARNAYQAYPRQSI